MSNKRHHFYSAAMEAWPRHHRHNSRIGDTANAWCSGYADALADKASEPPPACQHPWSAIVFSQDGNPACTRCTMNLVVTDEQRSLSSERWISFGSLNNGRCCYARASDFAACCLPFGHDGAHRNLVFSSPPPSEVPRG